MELLGSSMQGGGWAVKEDGGEGGRWMGSLEMIGGKRVVLLALFWPSKLQKMPPRAFEIDFEVIFNFGILCLFQRVMISQSIVYFSSHIRCHFEGIWKRQ